MPTLFRANRASIRARDHSIRSQGTARAPVAMGVSRMGNGNMRSIPSRPALASDGALLPAPMPRPMGSPYLIEGPIPAASKLAEVRGKLARCERSYDRLQFLLAQVRRLLDNGDVEGARAALASLETTP